MTSKIEWTNETWNPVTGCSKVSEGCKHCYAEREWARLSANPKTVYHGRKFTDVQFHPERLDQPLRWKKPRMIFVNSMSDLFLLWGDDLIKVFAAMMVADHHIYQILTKRPDIMQGFMEQTFTYREQTDLLRREMEALGATEDQLDFDGPPGHIWLGVSFEDQDSADEMLGYLQNTLAAVRFGSYEPALGAVDLERWLRGSKTIHMSLNIEGAIRQKRLRGFKDKNGNPMKDEDVLRDLFDLLKKGHKVIPIGDCPNFDPKTGCPGHPNQTIDWVIAGGESGPKARPSHPDWFRKVRDQCQAVGVPFFFKQWGEWAESDWIPGEAPEPDGENFARIAETTMCRVGKKRAGRKLDGREWNEYPGGGV